MTGPIHKSSPTQHSDPPPEDGRVLDRTRGSTSDAQADERLIAETTRLYRRYQTEVVEAFNLCPWAKRAREDDRVVLWVCLESLPTGHTLLPILDQWERDDSVEIGIALFPNFAGDRRAFERLATDTMRADADRRHLHSAPFVLAAFHPQAPLSLDSAERLIPYLRRTPDPTLQVVRVSSLERVRNGETSGTQYVDPSQLDLTKLQVTRPLRERIAEANLATVDQDPERLAKVIDLIQSDHRSSRRRLLDDRTGDTADAPG